MSILRVVPLTDTLDHIKDYGKITEKIFLYICHGGNVVHDLDHEVSKPVDNDVVYVRLGLCVVPPTKKYCVKYKPQMIVNPVGIPKLMTSSVRFIMSCW